MGRLPSVERGIAIRKGNLVIQSNSAAAKSQRQQGE